jgi:anthranilate synthase component 2
MRILMIDNYDSFVYNLVHMFKKNCDVTVKRSDQVSVDDVDDLRPDRIVISPGPGRPSDPLYQSSKKIILKHGPNIPTLGVCLGHQTIGYSFGAKIVVAKKMMHGKLSRIKHNANGLFKGVKNPLNAARYHSLLVSREALPRTLEVTAESLDGHEIMGLRHVRYPIVGVQFHPESIITEQGSRLISNFLKGNL